MLGSQDLPVHRVLDLLELEHTFVISSHGLIVDTQALAGSLPAQLVQLLHLLVLLHVLLLPDALVDSHTYA